eukprot:485085_1
MLYSFKEEKEYDNPTEIFDLRIYNKAKKSSDGKTGQFELSSPNDSRIFLASSQNEMKDWIKHIKLASSRKQKSASISGLPTKKRSTKNNPNSATSKINSSNSKKKLKQKPKPKSKSKPKLTPKQTQSKKKSTNTKKKNAVKQSPKKSPKQTPKQTPKKK